MRSEAARRPCLPPVWLEANGLASSCFGSHIREMGTDNSSYLMGLFGFFDV